MVELLATHDGDRVLKTWLPQMEKEYQYWMKGADALEPGKANQRVVRMEDGALLNRYWDDNDTRVRNRGSMMSPPRKQPESPGDRGSIATCVLPPPRAGISARAGWMTRKTGDHPHHQHRAGRSQRADVPHGETLSRASKAAGDSAKAAQYDALANDRQKALEKYLWNDKAGWYADYDLKTHKVRNQLTAAALFPLYVNAASRERAAKVAAAAESQLLKPGGLTTTTVNSGQQWDAPNGWAPLQWVAAQGLQTTTSRKLRWR